MKSCIRGSASGPAALRAASLSTVFSVAATGSFTRFAAVPVPTVTGSVSSHPSRTFFHVSLLLGRIRDSRAAGKHVSLCSGRIVDSNLDVEDV